MAFEGFDPLLAKLELEAMTADELKELLSTTFGYDDDDLAAASKDELVDEAWLWINPAPDPVDEDEAAADAAATLEGAIDSNIAGLKEEARASAGLHSHAATRRAVAAARRRGCSSSTSGSSNTSVPSDSGSYSAAGSGGITGGAAIARPTRTLR